MLVLVALTAAIMVFYFLSGGDFASDADAIVTVPLADGDLIVSSADSNSSGIIADNDAPEAVANTSETIV